VNETWIVNASPVIALARIGHLDLLSQLADEVLIPDAVVSEVLAGAPSDPARKVMESGWGGRTSPREMPAAVLEWSLGAGESAVLALALERPGCRAVLDDSEARSCARVLEVPLIGTLGVVLRAKRTGLISSASRVLESLQSIGFRLDPEILRSSLERATGERWPPG
jgi:predicted nucleic acid-binding protein